MNSTHNYLYTDEEDQIVNQWNSYKGSTVRPTASTERYYRQILTEKAPRTALVFGATPEIRTILRELGCSSAIVDRSASMVQAMSRIAHSSYHLPSSETYIEADWCSLPLADSSFELAIGDDSINMLDWNEFENFLLEAKRILTPKGIFICRLLIAPPTYYREQSILQVVEQFDQSMITSFADFASRVNFTQFDSETFKMGWQSSIAALKRSSERGEIVSDLGFTERFSKCNSIFSCPPQALWEELVSRHFSIEAVWYPDDFDYCAYEPAYVLRKF